MDLSAVMDQLAQQLSTIPNLRVYAFPPDSVHPPAAIVSFPDAITYDATYGRGTDTMTIPVVVMVGKVSDRTSRTLLSEYADGSGTRSIKAVLEAGTYTAFDEPRVDSVDIDVISMGDNDYWAANFQVSIAGRGA